MTTESNTGPLIVVGCDFSKPSEEAISVAGELAKREAGRVKLVYCLHDDLPPLVALRTREQVVAGHKKIALENLQKLGEAGLGSVPFEVEVTEGKPSRAIVRVAKEEGAELVVLASRGHSLASEILLGSTAEGVARHAPCSVLLVRPSGAKREKGETS